MQGRTRLIVILLSIMWFVGLMVYLGMRDSEPKVATQEVPTRPKSVMLVFKPASKADIVLEEAQKAHLIERLKYELANNPVEKFEVVETRGEVLMNIHWARDESRRDPHDDTDDCKGCPSRWFVGVQVGEDKVTTFLHSSHTIDGAVKGVVDEFLRDHNPQRWLRLHSPAQ